MEFRSATAEDLAYAAEHSISRAEMKRPDLTDYVHTLEHDGAVLGVGGMKMLNAHCAWCWMNWTTDALKFRTVAYRTVKSFLDAWMASKDITRIMAAVDPDFDEAIRTAEHLGFHLESTMPGFLGDRPALMYVRLREK